MPKDTQTDTDVIDVEAQTDEFSGGFDDEVTDTGAESEEKSTDENKDDETSTEADDKPEVKEKEEEPAAPATDEKPAEEEPVKEDEEKTLEQKAEAKADTDAYQARESSFWAEIDRQNPEVKKTVETAEFSAWLAKQPKEVIAMADQNEDANKAMMAFKLFESRPADDASNALVIPPELGEDFFTKLMVKDGDKEKTFEAMVEEYGEVGAMVQTGLKAIYAQLAQGMGQKDIPTDLLDRIGGIDSKVSDLSYWGEIQTQHPDARSILTGAEYKTWLAGQNALVQKFAESHEASDVVAVLDTYKKDAVGKAALEVKDRQGATRKKIGKVLKSGPQSGNAGTKDGAEEEDDFGAGFTDNENE